MFTTAKSAEKIVGTLSKPSKMPCFGYSIPAKFCFTGGKLHGVQNSVCSKCYALKGRYVFPKVVKAMTTRFNSLKKKTWVEAMTFLISKKDKSGFFRWHDSGDIQGVDHLKLIVEVCKKTPKIKHWLPTREYGFVESYKAMHGEFPENLTIRLSAFMVNLNPPHAIAKRLDVVTSSVVTDKNKATCLSFKQGGKCLDCRKCWNKNVANVAYLAH